MTSQLSSPKAYQQNTVLAASPAQLVVMLYDGAQRFLRQASAAIDASEVERAHNALRRAEQIIIHLDTVLEHEHNPRLATQLSSLYRFCLEHLQRARFHQDAGQVQEAARLLVELRGSWAELAAA